MRLVVPVLAVLMVSKDFKDRQVLAVFRELTGNKGNKVFLVRRVV